MNAAPGSGGSILFELLELLDIERFIPANVNEDFYAAVEL